MMAKAFGVGRNHDRSPYPAKSENPSISQLLPRQAELHKNINY
jgi:hypothetical protein